MTLVISNDPNPLRLDESGTVRVGQTRVILDIVIEEFLDGVSPEEIIDRYTTLRLADVYHAIGYYLDHRVELDAYLKRRREEGEALRRELEARFDQKGFRERLLARRAKQQAADSD